MVTDAHAERTRWRTTVVVVIVILAVSNVVTNRLLPAWTYVPWNVAVAGAIVLVARREVQPAAMGLAEWRRGAAWGAALFVLTAIVLVIALAMPAFEEMYRDRRVEGGTAVWLYQAVVRIPLGTALLEEVAFRGVLPGLLAVRVGVLRASVWASVLFGLWHVLPAMHLNTVNPSAASVFGDGPLGVLAAVTFGVVGTTVAGLWWCWIRYRARSVLATVIAHVATNSIAYTIAHLVTTT